MKKNWKYGILILLALLVFAIFYRISVFTPLAGDDWGYALAGDGANPFKLAYNFYFDWSGRFFSEFWGFAIACRKYLWNILNPSFFTLIFIFAVLLGSKKTYLITSSLLILVLMFNVDNSLRMETYTWIMGTTYVIPLCLSLIYFYLVEKKLYTNKFILVLTNLLCFYIGFTMENIAAVMVFAIALMLGYQYWESKTFNKVLLVNMMVGLIAFIIMRLSPGSSFRYARDFTSFASLGIFEKIAYNMGNFIQYSFMDNRYLIGILSLLLIALVFKNQKLSISLKLLVSAYLGIMIVIVFSSILIYRFNWTIFNFFFEYTNYLNWLIWLVYVVVVLVLICKLMPNNYYKAKIIFFILIGGASNFVMLFSPIYGSRSSLYFVYFLSIAIVILFNELAIKKSIVLVGLCLLLSVFTVRKINEYNYKYEAVNKLQIERLSIIDYYIYNSDIKEVHIPRMPPLTVHGADIEPEDTYHMEVFKSYYGLSPDCDVIFEWKDSYN